MQQYELLTNEQVEQVHEASLQILTQEISLGRQIRKVPKEYLFYVGC